MRRSIPIAGMRFDSSVPHAGPNVRGARFAWAQRRRVAAYALLALALGGCDTGGKLPDRASKDYASVVSAFNVGLAALQVGDDTRADARLAEVTKLAPGEPAGWADWGVLALRQRNWEAAGTRLERARELAPRNAHIYNLIGHFENGRGRTAQAIESFRKSAEIDPQDLRNTFALAQSIERQGERDADAEYQKLIEKILAARPENLPALLELARIAAKREDADTLKSAVARLGARKSAWPPEVQEQYAALEAASAAGQLRPAATRTTLLRNVFWRVPEYRQDYAMLKAPAGEEVAPFTAFLKLEAPVSRPSPPDTALAFEDKALFDAGPGPWNWSGALQLASTGAPVAAVANSSEVRLASGATLPFPGGSARTAPTPEGILPVDFTYDFKTDLVLAGAGGVRFYRQESPGAFTDVTGETKLPEAVQRGRYTGAWALDIELDGDLDIVLGAAEGQPVVLQNNGDGTFEETKRFAGISGITQLVWADLDGDGTPDIALIDGGGRLHIFNNERQGQYRERPLPDKVGPVKAIAAGDANNDGVLDIVAVQSDGVVIRISDRNQGQAWDTAEIAKVPAAAAALGGDVRLIVADLDNNGTMDLVLAPVATAAGATTAAQVWLGDGKGAFGALERRSKLPLVFAAADLASDGTLALVGLDGDARPAAAVARGTKGYHWQIVRPHAAQAVGDQRINPFGIGGEIEIRSGLMVQKQLIASPQVHFGLGSQTHADIVRVVWPNGAVRAEFDVKADQEVETEQRLKGSCPFLFGWNGTAMAFVKDAVPWGSAIGLRINTLGSAKVAATEEWYKIGRDALAPHDGYYDLRFTAELWEVYYYDQLSLMVVDHPAGSEIFIDERFVIPPAKLAITTVATPRAIASAVDDTGRDVTALVATLDGKSPDSFGRGQYQGVTRDHYLEVDLGNDVPPGPLYLIAHGSIYPTDSSINVALSQGERWRAKGLAIEVPDGRGGWVVARDNLGFPAGRKKSVLLDLTGIFRPGTPHRVRLATNLEIYWDKIEWAPGLPGTPLKTVKLDPDVADLHYRGYSVIERPEAGGPELPDYNRLAGTKQRWRDPTGYYTRYGDVRELLKSADDRYAIVNSGDEISLRFAEQPPPPAGWVRDYVIMGDGWIKDGDYNSTFSATVLPLPYHAKDEYVIPPRRLEDEPVYLRHPEDWQTYHTRYVTADVFRNALRNPAPQ